MLLLHLMSLPRGGGQGRHKGRPGDFTQVQDEALEWVRGAVDKEGRLEADCQRAMRELRDALESTPR